MWFMIQLFIFILYFSCLTSFVLTLLAVRSDFLPELIWLRSPLHVPQLSVRIFCQSVRVMSEYVAPSISNGITSSMTSKIKLNDCSYFSEFSGQFSRHLWCPARRCEKRERRNLLSEGNSITCVYMGQFFIVIQKTLETLFETNNVINIAIGFIAILHSFGIQ